MPYATNHGVKIYWEEHGPKSGEPVLMIMGLSYTLDMWHRLLPAISSDFRAIVFDNRGVGRSDTPTGPYSIRMMARDARAVMKAAGVSNAHILSASMGGMIAQELAIGHPERVRSLMLGCTSYAGIRAKWPNLHRWPTKLFLKRLSLEEREWALAPFLYSPSTPKELIAEDIAVRIRSGRPVRGLLSQLAAILPWSSFGRLPRIRVPTMVMHGEDDRLIPLVNGRKLASRVHGARFQSVPKAGHMLTTDQQAIVSCAALEFLKKVTQRDFK